METWKKLTGWEFMLWDSSRFDTSSVLWVKQACEIGLYAFASDYIRLYAVYTHGGVYLDSDIEVVKPFDELLHKDLMFCYGSEEGTMAAECFGAEKGHPYIKKCMEYYESRPFFDAGLLPEIMKHPRLRRMNFIQPISAPTIMGKVFSEYFADAGYNIYGSEYFSPMHPVTGEIMSTENTFAIHHCAAGYVTKWARKRHVLVLNIAKIFGEKSFIYKAVMWCKVALWNLQRHK
jgi:hypothetical protein